eukprot:CAMPEP_0117029540 /NCGR_PEP_ID=MMETSP0472-20121206/21384_1 /TAXON_ID=693140 ORGANISM="Tiarina fusus, Strain LIS" /NCGR_SAMPLE_ID=MMETSP0472 /ASSEMBLY_ACC=CAM_ASM_000603 /LENGTH=353 /DNA_ID=CAMNT_0004737339 /DNA_START=33 /DNA_END=1091 /DNA_ORIENTATION=-
METLVNIRQFKEVCQQIIHEDEPMVDDSFFLGMDPSVFETDDLTIVDPDEQIRAAIEREMNITNHEEKQRQQEMDSESWLRKTLGIKGQNESDDENEESFTPPSTNITSQTPSEMAESLMLTADIPSYDELVKVKPPNLRCLDDSEQYSSKNKREVNYFTPHMQQVVGDELVDPTEVVISIAFFHPKKAMKMQEFLVLGSQTLVELKEAFYCLSDVAFEACTTSSGFFFIENVFYDDTRGHDSFEYSKEIIEWVQESNRSTRPEFGLYTSKKMENTTFNDLSLRVGVPYLYCHRGNCEHIMIVNEVRIIHDEDNEKRGSYPLQTFQNKIRRKKCRVCDIYPAKYVTRGDILAP